MSSPRIRDIVPIATVAHRYPALKLRPQGREYVGRCPFHDDRGRPNLYIVPEGNFFFCFVCRAWGDSADLVAKMEGLSRKEAAARLLSETWTDVEKARTRKVLDPWPVPTRDLAYRRMLFGLTLSDEDRAGLLARGLTPEAIEANGYRTLPPRSERDPVVDALSEAVGDLAGLPGFYREDQRFKLAGLPGLLIPVRDAEGRILGFQMRGMVEGRRTYSWLSSQGRQDGSSPGALAHLARPVGPVKTPSAVIVTEGPLKADVAAQRLGLHVIAVPGFALWRRAIPLLGALSPLRCAVAFDQDAEPVTAMLVGSVAREFADTLSEMGVQAFSAHWHTGKGIDDALAQGERIEFTAL